MWLIADGLSVGCRAAPQANARENTASDAGARALPAAAKAETPRAPNLMPRKVADQILRSELSLLESGYSVKVPPRCSPPDNPEDRELFCRVVLEDRARPGPACCALMFNSRMLIVAGVSPARRSTKGLKIGEGDGTASEDVNRAADLAGLDALQLRRVMAEGR